ncbi:MAG: hypothetical protein ACOVP7_10505 [Lacibacter sp.]
MKIEELAPLQVGKYITYRLDSLVFTNTGKSEEIHRYRVKHLIERQSTDNQNRPIWIVVTYITDSLGVGPWVQNGTYTITSIDKGLEVTENNLRTIRLKLPVKEGFLWKGNSYLPDRPYNPEFPLSIDANMDLWEYQYGTVDGSEQIGSNSIPDITTVLHIDSAENVPMLTDTAFASRELSLEKYAKNVGLVYKEFVLWENQPRPRTTGNPPNIVVVYDPVRIGFGIKMWMIDKN